MSQAIDHRLSITKQLHAGDATAGRRAESVCDAECKAGRAHSEEQHGERANLPATTEPLLMGVGLARSAFAG